MNYFEKGKVSILTPCYNGERFLDRYFDAICTQTYDDIELIFVNDGSSDNSEKICASWRSRIENRGYTFVYISQNTCKGASSAINRGLPHVTGEFLIWPDCDDTLMPASVERRVDFLNRHADYALVRSDYVAVHEETPEIIVEHGSDWADVKNEEIFDDLIFEKTFIVPGCYMVRSSVFFERIPSGEIIVNTGGGGQNWPILLPCSFRNKCGYIDEPLCRYFIRPDSVSHRIEGDRYSGHKARIQRYQEILINVINDFYLLSDSEKKDYVLKIHIKYILQRLDLALFYNKSDDAKAEMQALKELNIDPDISLEILYQLCCFGLSGITQKGCVLISRLYNKIR